MTFYCQAYFVWETGLQKGSESSMRKLIVSSLKNIFAFLIFIFAVGFMSLHVGSFSKIVYANTESKNDDVNWNIYFFNDYYGEANRGFETGANEYYFAKDENSDVTSFVASSPGQNSTTPVVETNNYQNKGDPFDKKYPPKFDIRTKEIAIDLSDQGSSNLCWSFAMVSAIEIGYMLKTSEKIDLSETHFAYSLSSQVSKKGFNRGVDAAGSFKMGIAYLTRWEGPVLQSVDPYTGDFEKRTEESNMRDNTLHVQGFQNVSNSYNDVKNAVLEYGSAVTSIYIPSNFSIKTTSSVYNAKTYGYYNDNNSNIYNHAVLIVGWDNDYPASNFTSHPPINGAWIVRNSWGASAGDKGYMYVSYADVNILKDVNCITNIEKNDNYDKMYMYDTFGETGSVHFDKQEAWFANVFSIGSGEEISAVSFYLPTSDTNYEIYLGEKLTSRKLVAKGNCEKPGYYTIKLDEPVKLISSTCVAFVKLTKAEGVARISIESNVMGYIQNATADKGQSYVSANGTQWIDIAEKRRDTNVCVRVFTKVIDTKEGANDKKIAA